MKSTMRVDQQILYHGSLCCSRLFYLELNLCKLYFDSISTIFCVDCIRVFQHMERVKERECVYKESRCPLQDESPLTF